MNGPPRGRAHVVVGDPKWVCSALERAHADGRLVTVTGVEELPERRVRVTAELRDPAAPPGNATTPAPAAPGLRQHQSRRWLVRAVVLVALAALASLVWLLVVAVIALIAMITAVVSWVAGHVVAIAVALGVVLVLSCSVGAKCAGLHCGGVGDEHPASRSGHRPAPLWRRPRHTPLSSSRRGRHDGRASRSSRSFRRY